MKTVPIVKSHVDRVVGTVSITNEEVILGTDFILAPAFVKNRLVGFTFVRNPLVKVISTQSDQLEIRSEKCKNAFYGIEI